MQRHGYITGMTGCGKSSLIEQRIYGQWLATRNTENTCIIYIDPHGDSVEKLKRTDLAQKYFDRMIYIDSHLKAGYTPCINPLQIDDIHEDNVTLHVQAIIDVFQDLLPDAKLSNYMKALLQPCLTTLLLAQHCSLHDLQHMMQKSTENKWVNLGKRSTNPAHKNFFVNHFHHKLYDYTKNSIATKLQSLLNSPHFYHFITGQSTIHLKQCIGQGKIILCNLSKGRLGEQVSTAMGKFIIAQVKSIALQRATLSPHFRTPIYLIVDEADSFLSGNESLNTILKETRKYGLHLVLLTQNIISGNQMASLRRNLLSNTYVKVIGMNSITTLAPLSKEINIPLSALQDLGTYQFWLHKGRKRPSKICIKPTLGSYSPLILDRHKVRSLHHRLITQTSLYKPIIPSQAHPDERIEEYPFDMRQEILNEAMPKPKFTL